MKQRDILNWLQTTGAMTGVEWLLCASYEAAHRTGSLCITEVVRVPKGAWEDSETSREVQTLYIKCHLPIGMM